MKKNESATPEHAAFTDLDKRRLKLQVGLWRAGLRRLKTSEDIDFDDLILRNWYEAWLDGTTFGDAWREYRVQYLGWLLDWQSKPLPADWYINNAYAAGIKTPERPDKPVQLCGIRIHHKQLRAFAEILLIGGHDSLDSLQNIHHCKSSAEIRKVLDGFNLFKAMQQQRGRKPRKYTDRAQFVNDAIEAHLRLVEKNKDNDYETAYEYSQERIAEEMGFKSVQGWRKRTDQLGVDRTELKGDATTAAQATKPEQPN